jgi:hypothetical protein
MGKDQVTQEYEFVLEHKASLEDCSIGAFEAVYSFEDKNEKKIETFPSFIKITRDNKTRFFKTRPAGKYKATLFINPKALEGKDNEDTIAWSEVTKRAFFLHRQWHDPSLRLLWIGLFLAIAGTFIDGSFTIGKYPNLVLFHPTSQQIGILLWLAMLLKVVGLIMVYVKGVREAK